MHLSSASPRGGPRADVGEYRDFMGTLQQIPALVVGEMWGLRFLNALLSGRTIIKIQFSSKCKVPVCANCSKNQNEVLKCVFKSSWVLGFAKYWGLCKKKSPTGGEIQELKNAQFAKSPYQPGFLPLGEANDK